MLTGVVIQGDDRGKALGFPTANLQTATSQQFPDTGIYAAWATLPPDTTKLPAAVHIGPRPTFASSRPTFEVHLINFPYQELYGRTLNVQLVTKLRDVKKFSSTDELVSAIHDDIKNTLAILAQ